MRVEAIGRDFVAHERCGQRSVRPLTSGRGEGRKITGEHRLRRHKAGCGGRIRAFDGTLVAGKKEQLILDDRAANHAAKLISLQRITARCEEIPRVEEVVPHELEYIPVDGVGSTLGDGIYRGRGVLSVARRKSAGFHFELLQRVRERNRQVQVVKGVVVGAAVEQVGHSVR